MIISIILFSIIILLSIICLILDKKYKKLDRLYMDKIEEIFLYKDIIENTTYSDHEKVNAIRWEMNNIPF